MRAFGAWIVGAMVVALGVIGLYLSAYADDGVMHATGLLIAGFSVLFVFGLIGSHAGQPASADVSAVGEGADRPGQDEVIHPLAAELGVGGAEGVDPGVQPGKVLVGALEEGQRSVV